MTALYQVLGDIAVITLDHPPVNGLDLATRRAVVQALLRAQSDGAVQAVVLDGAGRTFSGGADIKEFGTDRAMQSPHLLDVIELIESFGKPVVAALHGAAMGGGLELALGCHYRVASAGTRLALPEVKLGLLPGAGGTQRLPRVLGVEAALNLILSGEAVLAEAVARLPGQKLLDLLVSDPQQLRDAAVSFARSVAADRPLPQVRRLPAGHPQGAAFFQFARNTARAMAPHVPAPLACVDAVEAATTRPFEAGLAYERERFMGLMYTPVSRALRHVFLAERGTARIADVPDDPPRRPVLAVGVVGAGTMGSGIAVNFLDAGLPVALLESSAEALERGTAAVTRIFEGRVKKGKLSAEACTQRLALLQPTLDDSDLGRADLLIEAVYEDFDVKAAVFRRLDAVAKPGAILATNTSTLDVDRIAACTRRPQDVVGLHFFSPAHAMKLLEVVRGRETAPDVLATAMALARQIKKTAVVARVCDGFIGNRMLEQYFRQAGFLLDEGATPGQIDQAIERFGLAMGPFRMGDLAGNDIGWAIRKRRYSEQPDMRYSGTADRLCEMGRFGQKTGAGWYDYQPGQRSALPSAEVAQMIEAHRATLGLAPRRIGDQEIVQRLVYALVNEGARLLEEGIAAKSGDIDMVYLTGYGFPVWRGGPMHFADQQGLLSVVQTMRRFAANPHDDAAFWQPAPLLEKLAAQGGSFGADHSRGGAAS